MLLKTAISCYLYVFVHLIYCQCCCESMRQIKLLCTFLQHANSRSAQSTIKLLCFQVLLIVIVFMIDGSDKCNCFLGF